jgi:protein ImuB
MLWLCIRLPALRHEALAADEDEALQRLSAWAYQWSSQVCHRRGDESSAPLLWLELAASRALFGEPVALLARIEQALSELGYSHRCALAPSPAAAALLSRGNTTRCVSTQQQLHKEIAPLPLDWLELSPQILQALHCSGLRCIGDVLQLPRAALARRFGPQCSLYLARLLGEASDPHPSFQLPPVYRARCVFDYELHDTQSLLFPLQRLLQEFQGYLRARDRAVQSFTLELEHARRAGQSRRPSQLCIGLSTPTREATRFQALVRERLQSLVLAAPITAVSLIAQAFTAPHIVQTDLFGSEQQQLGELAHLLDRLRARLGGEAVQGLQLAADHRPELAFAHDPATPPSPATTLLPTTAQRPAALVSPPQRIEPPARLLSGPERIASGWWDGREVIRDYYLAQGADGSRQWIFHDLPADAWYLQGLWV